MKLIFLLVSLPLFGAIDDVKLRCTINSLREINSHNAFGYEPAYVEGFDDALNWVVQMADSGFLDLCDPEATKIAL